MANRNSLLFLIFLLTTTVGCLPEGGGKSSKSRWLNQVSTDPTPTATATATATPARPEGVIIEADYCACLDGLSHSIGNCDSICSDKYPDELTLYLNVSLEDEILLSGMNDLEDWCNTEINEEDVAPSCSLVADFNGKETYLDFDLNNKQSELEVVITSLSYDRTYLIQIEELTSGVRSNTIQLRLREPYDEADPLGPMEITPINQYTCITRSGTTVGGSNYYDMGAMSHYYYPDYSEPSNLSGIRDFLFCHDINLYGTIDRPEYPRLYLESSFMHFWSETDIRTYDADGDGKLDVNNFIENTLFYDYGVSGSDINIFVEFPWFNSPEASGAIRMGYIMQPWVDAGGDPYCPTSDHYYTDEPVFQILKDLVGVDTEGLYLAVKEAESITDSSGTVTELPPDYLLMREGLLTQIWFYMNNGTPVPADPAAAKAKTIMFYWPADTAYPLVKKSYQKAYYVRSPSQISDSSNEAVTGLRTIVSPSDKRIGCIPKLQ